MRNSSNDVDVNYAADVTFAQAMDRGDSLAPWREQFHVPVGRNGKPDIYFCGNSLGLQPKTAEGHVHRELRNWQSLAVKGHFSGPHPWMSYHELLTDKTARLVGALPVEVVSMNTLTVNLHLMLVSFYRPTRERYKIVIEKRAFPSDRYAVQSQLRFHGHDPADALIEVGTEGPGCSLESLEEVIGREGQSIAMIVLPGVQYYSGEVFDIAGIVDVGHAHGCTIGFDLAHAVGNVPLRLHDWDVDFAVWCNYKYMNGGPGAVAGCFVHERHVCDTELVRFAGWWGHDKQTRFDMGPEFLPIRSAEGWQLSNPPIFSLAPVLASLEIFDEVGIDALREKSLQLTGYFEYVLKDKLDEHVDIITPSDPAKRGCQLSIRVKSGRISGRAIYQTLLDEGLVCDWREPDVIRAAPVPLYNQFFEVHRFVDSLASILS